MSEFKIGDRVRIKHDGSVPSLVGSEATIAGLPLHEGDSYTVSIDDFKNGHPLSVINIDPSLSDPPDNRSYWFKEAKNIELIEEVVEQETTVNKIVGKYAIPFTETFEVELPVGAEIIRVDTVDGFAYIWAVVDLNAPTEKVKIHGFKTGGKIPSDLNLEYIGCAAIFVQMELMLYFFREI